MPEKKETQESQTRNKEVTRALRQETLIAPVPPRIEHDGSHTANRTTEDLEHRLQLRTIKN